MHNRIVKSFEKINTKTNVDKNVVTFLKAFDGSDALIEQVNGNAIVTADGANYYNGLYNHYIEGANKIGNAILMNGTGISGQSQYANEAVINSVVKNDINNRTIKLKNEKIFGLGGSIDSNYIIPTGLDGTDFQIGTTNTGRLSSIFLNGDSKLLTRIENAINNNEEFKNFEGTIAQANPIIEGIIEMEIAKMREEGIKGLPPSFTSKDDVKADASVTDDTTQTETETETETKTETETTEFGKSGFVGVFKDMNNEQAYNYVLEVAKENDNMSINEVINDFENNNQEVPAIVKWMSTNTTETADEMGGISNWRKKHGYKPEGGFLLKYDFDPSTGLKKFVDPSLTAGHVEPRPKQGTIPQGEWDRIWSNTHNPDGTPKQIPADI